MFTCGTPWKGQSQSKVDASVWSSRCVERGSKDRSAQDHGLGMRMRIWVMCRRMFVSTPAQSSKCEWPHLFFLEVLFVASSPAESSFKVAICVLSWLDGAATAAAVASQVCLLRVWAYLDHGKKMRGQLDKRWLWSNQTSPPRADIIVSRALLGRVPIVRKTQSVSENMLGEL